MTVPITQAHPLLLGSASPRRRALLEELRIPLVLAEPAVIEDTEPGEGPANYVARIVAAKGAAIAALPAAQRSAAWLVADTTVVLGDAILGKPSNVDEAFELLSRLSGRTHEVLTRYAIGVQGMGPEPSRARTVRSLVSLRLAAPETLRRYARTGEGLDKAGAYAVQGIGAFLVERIEGSYANVVGLPVAEVVVDLEELGLLPTFPEA